jgi:hypothetical protein
MNMEALTKIFIAMLNLLEAEGRAMQRGVVRLWMLLLMTLGACALALGGVVALSYGFYWLLIALFGKIAAVSIVGVTLLVIAGGIAWAIYSMVRLKEPTPNKAEAHQEAEKQSARIPQTPPPDAELSGRAAPIPT